jgi:signal transduction histidine kinase
VGVCQEEVSGGLQRIALARYDLHCGVLTTLAALGLFFVGGVRAPVSWVVFVLAAVAATLLPRRWLLTHAVDTAAKAQGQPSNSGASASSRSKVPPSQQDPDDIDYLRALRHELRTPLNAVLGFADVLLSGIDGEINDSQREDLEIIRASGIRLRILLDSALDLTKLGSDDFRLDRERMDVRELVRRAAGETEQLWSSKRELCCQLPPEPAFAELDESRIRRSILVLADSLATTYRSAHMRLALQTSADHVAIVVSAESDEPIAIDAPPIVAEVLASEDPGTIRQWPVAVTSELVGLHGGSLYHGSRPSRFLLRLPKGSAS